MLEAWLKLPRPVHKVDRDEPRISGSMRRIPSFRNGFADGSRMNGEGKHKLLRTAETTPPECPATPGDLLATMGHGLEEASPAMFRLTAEQLQRETDLHTRETPDFKKQA